MASSMVNSPALLLCIFVYHGIWLNGKTYSAPPNPPDCENSFSEACQDSYTVKSTKNISKELREVFDELKEIEIMENQILKEIKGKADKKKKENLVGSFINRLKGMGPKKEIVVIDKDKENITSTGNAEYDEDPTGKAKLYDEDKIYTDLFNIDILAQGCISDHFGENGTIHFSTANLTGNWRTCLWNINTTGSAFEITFRNFSMDSCEILVIGDSIALRPIAFLSGNSIPGSVRLPHLKAYILFVSLCETNKRTAEFTLHWNTVESGCNGWYNNDYGLMHHPARSYNSPSEMMQSNLTYSNNESCTWVINSTRLLNVRFLTFSTEECCDFLHVRDGNTSKSDLVAILRGNISIPRSINTTSNSVQLQFTSDYSNVGPGFTMLWKVVYESIEQSDCGGIYSTESGTIHHPATSGKSYKNNQNCTWLINSAIELEISFDSFNTERCCDHLYVRDGSRIGSPLLGRFSGNVVPRNLRTKGDAHIKFISDRSIVRAGFVLRWNTSSCGGNFTTDFGSIQYPVTNGGYPDKANCTWVIVSSGASIELTFKRFSTESCCDFVYIRDGGNRSAPLLGRYSGNAVPSSMRTTTNKAFIHFTSDNSITKPGFALTWNTNASGNPSGCGGQFNTDSGSIQYPVTSSVYPDNANCSWVIVSSGGIIELNFTRLSTEACCDFVHITNGDSIRAPLLGRYSGNALPSTVRTTANKAFIHFTSDHSMNRPGFALTWNKIGCDGVFNNDTGIIHHPRSGGNYQNNENCTWIIRASNLINITFGRFNTESGFDYLYIRDGESIGSTVLGRFSGTDIPSSVRTRANIAHLHFKSDRSITRSGFVLQWNATGCGVMYNSDSGMIRHPLGKDNYGNNENCTWLIRALHPINITFVSFDTEEDDYLYIRDGETIGSPLLGRYHGTNIPRTVHTTTKTAHLQFTSDGNITRAGFVLHWNASECGGHYKNDSGVIRFPKNGGMYDNNQHCVWIIETTGPFIELTFANFSTEGDVDILTIRDGNNSGSPLIGKYSMRVRTSLRTATSSAYLSFTSDGSYVRTGFVIHWNTTVAEGNSDCSCGSVNSYQEIVGGEDVEYAVKYPWHVGIFRPRQVSSYQHCGGTLISDKYVLTAAHCLFPPYPEEVVIKIGDHIQQNTTEDIEGITETVSVEKVFIKPGFIRRIKHNDFALLRLSRSITITDGFGIRPICLPQTPHKNYTGEMGLAVGWGTLNQYSRLTPYTLQQVEMTILPPECLGWPRIIPAMMCAFSKGKDTCQGDSGGSLAVVETGSSDGSGSSSNGTNEHYVLVGVTSWGIGCAATTPGVYSRVTTALDWIQRFVVTCSRRGNA